MKPTINTILQQGNFDGSLIRIYNMCLVYLNVSLYNFSTDIFNMFKGNKHFQKLFYLLGRCLNILLWSRTKVNKQDGTLE